MCGIWPVPLLDDDDGDDDGELLCVDFGDDDADFDGDAEGVGFAGFADVDGDATTAGDGFADGFVDGVATTLSCAASLLAAANTCGVPGTWCCASNSLSARSSNATSSAFVGSMLAVCRSALSC